MKFILATVSLLVLSCYLIEVEAMFGSMGGGCCGGCGCGRRKRSIEESSDEGDGQFFGISSNHTDMMCNNSEMKKVMVKGMRKSAIDSSRSIQKLFDEQDLYRYVVICSEAPFVYTIRHDTAYCSSKNDKHFCQAFAI